jgi:hypothetical protein
MLLLVERVSLLFRQRPLSEPVATSVVRGIRSGSLTSPTRQAATVGDGGDVVTSGDSTR